MKQTFLVLAACTSSFFLGAFVTSDDPKKPITADMVAVASKLFDLEFTAAERDSMLDNLNNARTNYEALRKIDLPNDVAPALYFNPLPAGFTMPTGPSSFKASSSGNVTLPTNRDEPSLLHRRAIGYLDPHEADFIGRTHSIFPESS